MEHLSNDQQDHPNQQEKSHKLCDETGHDTAMQWNWDTTWSEFSNGGKSIVEQILWNQMKWNIFFWITFT